MKRRISSVLLIFPLLWFLFPMPAIGQAHEPVPDQVYGPAGECYPIVPENVSYVGNYEPMAPPVQETPPSPPPSRPEKLPVIDVNTGWVGEADVSDGQGSFSFNHLQASLSYSYFSLSYTQHLYQWNDVHRLPFGNGVADPWETLHRLGLSARYNGRINQRWGYFVNGGLSFGYESSMDRPEFRFMGGAVFGWTPKLKIQLGFVLLNHSIRSLIMPVVGVRFGEGRGADRSGWSGALGFPETQITYRFDPHVALKLAGFVDSRVYKLGDNSTVEEGGYLETRDYAGGLFLLYSPIPNMDASLGGGYIFKRDFLTYNDDGHKRGDYDIGLAPLVRFGVKYRF